MQIHVLDYTFHIGETKEEKTNWRNPNCSTSLSCCQRGQADFESFGLKERCVILAVLLVELEGHGHKLGMHAFQRHHYGFLI